MSTRQTRPAAALLDLPREPIDRAGLARLELECGEREHQSNEMKLSVIIPVYNEASTVEQLVTRVKNVPLDKEIVIVEMAQPMARGTP